MRFAWLYIMVLVGLNCCQQVTASSPTAMVVGPTKFTLLDLSTALSLRQLLWEDDKNTFKSSAATQIQAVIDDLIEARLLRLQAEKDGFSLDLTVVERAYLQLTEQAKPQNFANLLAAVGVREGQLWMQLYEMLLAQNFLRDYLQRHQAKQMAATDLPPPPAASSHKLVRHIYSSSLDPLKGIYAQVKVGQNIDALMQWANQAQIPVYSFDLGEVQAGILPQAYENAILSLKPGHLSDILHLDGGYHFFIAQRDGLSQRRGLPQPEGQDETERRLTKQLLTVLRKRYPVQIKEKVIAKL